MAVCVVGATWDTDRNRMLPACTVHCCYAPCFLNGEPASETPLEAADETGRLAALSFWALRTKQQRPLIMHHGSWLDEPFHDGRDCWCSPEFFPAREVAA